MALRLVRCAPGDDPVVEATDLGIELNDCGIVVNSAVHMGDAGTTNSEAAP